MCDFSFMMNPRDSRVFITKRVELSSYLGERARIRKSSKYECRRINILWRYFFMGVTTLEKAQGAGDRPKGRNWKTKVLPPSLKARNL